LRQQRIAAKEASATVTIRWIVIGAILVSSIWLRSLRAQI